MSARLFKVNGGYLIAKDLLAVVTHLVGASRRPPHPSGLYGDTQLHVEDLGEVKLLSDQ